MNTYAHPEVLVDTGWLAEHLDDPSLRVVHVGLEPGPYQAGHVPGAVFWEGLSTLLGPDYRTNFEPGAVETLLGRSGVSNDTTVVACSDHPALAPWVFWFLQTIGHDDVRVLDGGLAKWVAEGRLLTTEVPDHAEVSYRSQAPAPARRAFLDQVRTAAHDDESILIDVRTPEEYRGEIFMVEPPQGSERAGHIPGSVHLYYEMALNEDGTFRSVDELTTLYAAHGIESHRSLITYCAVGMRSAHTWFVLTQLLGWPTVTSYDGSWNEWGRLSDTPIEAST